MKKSAVFPRIASPSCDRLPAPPAQVERIPSGWSQSSPLRGRAEDRPRLLIAGGARSLQTAYAQFMERRGFSTCCVGTGQAVLDRLAYPTDPIHLLLLDADMPGMQQARLLQRLRLQRVTTPILVVADKLSPASRATFEELGVAKLLPKPLTAESLVAAAVNLLPTFHLPAYPPITP